MMLGPKGTSPCAMEPEAVQGVCLCGWEAASHDPAVREVHEAFAKLDRLEAIYQQVTGRPFRVRPEWLPTDLVSGGES